jgi:hypothetical protein
MASIFSRLNIYVQIAMILCLTLLAVCSLYLGYKDTVNYIFTSFWPIPSLISVQNLYETKQLQKVIKIGNENN